MSDQQDQSNQQVEVVDCSTPPKQINIYRPDWNRNLTVSAIINHTNSSDPDIVLLVISRPLDGNDLSSSLAIPLVKKNVEEIIGFLQGVL